MKKNKKQSRTEEVVNFISENPACVADEIQKMLTELCPSDCCACRWVNICDTAGQI